MRTRVCRMAACSKKSMSMPTNGSQRALAVAAVAAVAAAAVAAAAVAAAAADGGDSQR